MSEASSNPEVSQPSQSRHLLLALLAIVALSVALRLPGIGRPLVGTFATKQVVYAMIARNWAEGRATLWHPTLDVLVGGQRSLHMLELPVSAYLTGGLWRTFGGSLDAWGRATSVALTVGSVVLLFLLVRSRYGVAPALGAAAVLALSPVSVVYGQSFMLEASLVFFTVATFYALDRWLRGGRFPWLVAAAVALALLLLTKIYMLVVLLPLAVTALLAVRAEPAPRTWLRWATTAGVLALAIVPAAAWYYHAAATAAPDNPLAKYVFYSVRDSAAVHRPPHPLLGSPDFYRRLLDDLAGVVLTPVGFMLLLAGLLDRAWRREAVWLAAMLLLVVALPRKFYEMNYYWMAVLPPLCVVAGLGWGVVCRGLRRWRTATAGLLLVGVMFSLRYAAGPAFVTPEEDRAVVAAAAAVRDLTRQEEPVVTVHGSTIDLLYYCDRPGWALAPDTRELESVLEECRRHGARVAVVTGARDAAGEVACPAALARRPVIARGDGFRVFELAR